MILETKNDRDILHFAFRYALGRKTGAVYMLVEYLTKHWEELEEWEQIQIVKEIKNYRHMNKSLPWETEWNKIIELKPKVESIFGDGEEQVKEIEELLSVPITNKEERVFHISFTYEHYCQGYETERISSVVYAVSFKAACEKIKNGFKDARDFKDITIL